MNDTSSRIEAMLKEIWRKKDPAVRLAMGCSMFGFAKDLVRSRLQELGRLDAATERREFFLRFYGNEFNPTQKEKILKHLSRSEP